MLDFLFRSLKHHRAIAEIQRRFERYETEIDEKIDRARLHGEPDEVDSLVSEFFFEKDQFDAEIASRETRFLIHQARRYLIPVPPTRSPGMWEQAKNDGRWVLTYEAMRELRQSIRIERRERADPVKTWLPLATGFIGALIGLVAIFH